MALESTIIPVRRVQIVADTLDLAPFFARHDIMPERLKSVTAHASADGEAFVGLTYGNGVYVCTFTNLDEHTETYSTDMRAYRGSVSLLYDEALFYDRDTTMKDLYEFCREVGMALIEQE